ncbi:HNH endonuclease [Pectobacterium phage vB_PatP_CB4]|uniref:HNH endonuclease n=1 Tax=Pectobacterium phage vB_PatP_CB4 TaxID=1958919 RepID=A0A2P9J4Y2_9CAUD|nr:HNH endonuclease [Pectobacterium phage vB_PatP_CB4]AQT27888.1 HNH endonuclease [Pectobacterium phage vB_PatP_CB4]
MHIFNQESLKSVLRYVPESGQFYWLISPKWGVEPGTIAGSPNADGYTLIMYKRVSYRANVLAWLYMTGFWPDQEIDHIDTVRSNNAWNNLRKASDCENAQNSSLRRDNKSGIKGISWSTQKGKWVVYIQANKQKFYLGAFTDLDAAKETLNLKRAELHGNFANTGSLK